jgi:hypothetical protein
MPISHLCQNLNFTNFNQVGTCFSEFVFFGDVSLGSLVVIILFVLVGVKAQLPLEVMYPSLLGLMFALWLFSGAAWLMGFFLLGLLIGGAMLGLKFLENLGRS